MRHAAGTAYRYGLYRAGEDHSLKSDPDAFFVQVPSQLVDGIPGNIPRALLPEYITELILSRSPGIGKVKNLRASERHAPRPDKWNRTSHLTQAGQEETSESAVQIVNNSLRTPREIAR